jgi:ketosteroid isomerase-like protein
VSLADEEMIARLRCSYEAFNRGDFDAAMEFAHPDILFVRPGAQAEVRGAEAVRAWMEPDAFESQVIEPLEFRVSGTRSSFASTPRRVVPAAASRSTSSP